LDNGSFSFITSTLTILEVLVQPIKMNRQDLVEQYKHILALAKKLIWTKRTGIKSCVFYCFPLKILGETQQQVNI